MIAPDDIAPKRGPEGREWIPFTIVTVVVFGLFAAEIAIDFDVRKYGALMVLVFWVPLLVIHELGHALAAKLVGWRVLELVIGFGKPIKRFHVGGTRVELRTFPLEGFVLPAPRTLRGAPWKNAFVYFAGPGLEIALILVAGWLVGFDALLSRSDEIGMVTLQAACGTAAIGAAMNLIPFPIAGGLVSDGLGVLLSLRSRPEHYASSLATPYRRVAAAAVAAGDFEAARASLRKGLALHPSNAWLKIEHAVVQAAAGDAQGAHAALAILGTADGVDSMAHATWLHAQARIALESLDDDLLMEADAYAEAAMKSQPGDVGARITRGATLMERMRYPEAARLLGDAVHDAHHEIDRARGLMYLAILEARRGRSEHARKALTTLQRIDGVARYVGRAAEAIEEESAR